jgi:hypothetical protein
MKEHPYRSRQAELAPGDFERWIKESLFHAQVDVFSSDLIRFEMPSEKYKKKAYKLARSRLAIAGYRMGDLFNQAFATVAAPVSAPN